MDYKNLSDEKLIEIIDTLNNDQLKELSELVKIDTEFAERLKNLRSINKGELNEVPDLVDDFIDLLIESKNKGNDIQSTIDNMERLVSILPDSEKKKKIQSTIDLVKRDSL
jgi:hypothetical protein